jgi:hypothetical protein
MADRLADLMNFYILIERLEEKLGGARRLCECTGRLNWPDRGVYFFREPGEFRLESGRGPRVVRVGTHALAEGSRTRLWTRLSQHLGSQRSGGGNHRGSIFRLLIGTALCARDGLDPGTWGAGNTAPRATRDLENELEIRVSKFIGAMSLVWLPIADVPGPSSQRGYVERNAIALLSNYGKPPLDAPSPEWLGSYCARERVRTSGLWNQNHVDERYDPIFLERLSHMIDRMEAA